MNVVINGWKWEIVYTSDRRNLSRSNGTLTVGVTDCNEMRIYLYEGLTGALERKVLLHELTHAFVFSYGYFLTPEEEEFLCSFMDTYADDVVGSADMILRKFIKNNKKLLTR